MGRPPRAQQGGMVFHVLNRANAGATIFEKAADYAAFETAVEQAHDRLAIKIFAYCVMPNHWHMVVRPAKTGDLADFFGWLSLTHTRRWHEHRHSTGGGHLYQGRYKSFPVATDHHFLTLCRYVERNAVRAKLAKRAEDWRWSSLARRHQKIATPWLSEWPVDRSGHWLRLVNAEESERELARVRASVHRGRPFGDEEWVTRTAHRLELASTLRPRGRPKLVS